MSRSTSIVLAVVVIAVGLWVGARWQRFNQKVYSAPEQYTEQIEGLDGLPVR